MARITEDEIQEVKNLHEKNKTPHEIAEKTGLKLAAVKYQLSKLGDAPAEAVDSDEDTETVEYWKAKCVFWIAKYAEAHIKLVDNEIDFT